MKSKLLSEQGFSMFRICRSTIQTEDAIKPVYLNTGFRCSKESIRDPPVEKHCLDKIFLKETKSWMSVKHWVGQNHNLFVMSGPIGCIFLVPLMTF